MIPLGNYSCYRYCLATVAVAGCHRQPLGLLKLVSIYSNKNLFALYNYIRLSQLVTYRPLVKP
jgi:hypothetical protein